MNGNSVIQYYRKPTIEKCNKRTRIERKSMEKKGNFMSYPCRTLQILPKQNAICTKCSVKITTKQIFLDFPLFKDISIKENLPDNLKELQDIKEVSENVLKYMKKKWFPR